MPDLIISASASNEGFAIVAGITTELVREAQSRHGLSPTASAAVGRLTTGAALLGASLKGKERISLQIQGDGPLRSIVADAWLIDEERIGARGYAKVPDADLPLNARGKFDVAGAIGEGSMQVTKSYEVGQPYVGVVPLYSGEIAEDIAAYLVNSEQIPSVVALGVLADPDGVKAAGGVIAQILPGADERAVAALEERALAMPPITKSDCRRRRRACAAARLGGTVEFACAPDDRRALFVPLHARESGNGTARFRCRRIAQNGARTRRNGSDVRIL